MSSSSDQVVIPMLQRHTNDLPEMIAGDQETITQGAVLSFHNICYRVQVKSGSLLQHRTVEKEILSNISGIMKPGLNAIMVPKGQNKSLLLNILAARKDPSGLSGDVLINGEPRPANFKYHSGYVVQNNVLMNTLTVRENLQFSAALRLPTTMTNHEKNERINKVIEDLDLNEVANSKVLSRGEKKRTSIAMELIADPPVLFLDRPTTGLHISTANTVLLLLKRISEQGPTIIFTINHPRYSIFKLFDSLTLLASGKLMYQGPAQKALEYFTSAGYPCELYSSPAVFFLEIINGEFSAMVLNREEEGREVSETEELSKGKIPVIETLVEFYLNSSIYRETKAELDQLSGGQKKRSSAFKETTYITSFYHQFRWIVWRFFKNLLSDPEENIFQITVAVILGVVIGAFFLALKHDCTDVYHRARALCTLTIFQSLAGLLGGKSVELEKLFRQELISRWYEVSSYFFGKLVSDLLPRSLLPIICTCVAYFLIGLKLEAEAFSITVLTVLMVYYSTASLLLAIGSYQRLFIAAVLSTYYLLMLGLLGILLTFTPLPPWLSWLEYFSIPHYGYLALQHNEFWGRNYCPELNTTESSSCSNYVICTGEEFLTNQGIDLSPWSLWKNHVALAFMMIIFLTISYLKLLFLKRSY
ncbi:broad substrate specificity ATP-binding cassette transporter ABCG2-like isoform X1 [Marmota flaviventris]|uniref:broad substrate specificity ATP-binding cassette transporter ABCG2-like isoform X1 n=2 Tax=Marmota flaviventris TaxID=93162 RepID=UPI000FFF97FE|nr:broad substrate specificity ATP-binding cassette transporter ABCG2-like isoform X2 [Marmota flaviventris]